MEITAYPQKTEIADDDVFLIDGQSGTKIISAYNLANQLGQFVPVEQTVWTGTLSRTGWAGGGPWTQRVTLNGITQNDQPLVQSNANPSSFENKKAYLRQWGYIDLVETVTDGLIFTCKFDEPSIDLPFIVIKGGVANG